MSKLPMIPATVIGSWAFPGWYAKFCDDVARQPELFGEDDRSEAVLDAVRLAVDDQLRAGADLITDGEMQRVDFNLGFYDRLTGIQPLPQARRWGPPAHDQPEQFLDLVARTVAGVTARVSIHMCFGNYRGRAVGWRSYRPLFPHLARAPVQQLALGFASREMAEIELAREIKPPMELAVGVVDVKNTWVEPPELVAERLRLTLKYIEPERVSVTPDCGFSQTARFIARRKLKNMVEGVRIVRRELKEETRV